MTIISKAIALATVASTLALTATASADSDFTARFDYSADAPVAQTYARFEETAHEACKLDRVKAGGIAMKLKMEKACESKLLADAVAETRIPALIAYHDEQTGQIPTLRQYAEAN